MKPCRDVETMIKYPGKDVIFVGEHEKLPSEPLASEMYKDLQKHDAFKMKVIKWLVIALVISILGNIGQGFYHDWKWSQFDTYVVDSGDGSGNANLVQWDNTGGIFNGENNGADSQGREVQGEQNQEQ